VNSHDFPRGAIISEDGAQHIRNYRCAFDGSSCCTDVVPARGAAEALRCFCMGIDLNRANKAKTVQ
jgi:hypothetical protein